MATDYDNEVQKLYVAYFSRPADVAGLDYWANVLATDPSGYQKISASFAASQEYRDTYAGMDNNAVVSAVYEHLFGRAAETAGVQYWANLLNQKAITIDNVVTQIAGGAQDSDKFAYQAKVAVAGAFTDRVDTPAEKAAYSGTAANKIAIDYIASVHDIMTAAAGMDPGNIDMQIAKIMGNMSASDTAQVVGVADFNLPTVHG
ncbi:DUF4214 domain-containing protein [Massilia sp. TN1-12]|uniref:DUF4214 domain-containing protein n=1 Tax=Massilia paldalensis TaxID=3377675 RepID=UPI00384DAC60